MASADLNRVGQRYSLAGRTALVTGGSMSMGKAIALGLAEAGADIAIQASLAADVTLGNADAAEETRREIVGLSRRCLVFAADFIEPGAGTRAVREAEAALGSLDILVIGASIQARCKFTEVTPDDIARQIQINFTATVELLQTVLPGMAARGWGRVLSIGSVNETRPDPELSIYAALKAAQHNLVINLARQYAGSGVLLNTIAPGLVGTERNRWRRQDAAKWVAIQEAANPMKRAGTPDEIVGAALLLCSDAAGFITGARLEETGGGHL